MGGSGEGRLEVTGALASAPHLTEPLSSVLFFSQITRCNHFTFSIHNLVSFLKGTPLAK